MSVIANKLDEVSFLDELLNGNFKLEAILGIMAVVLVVSVVLVSTPFLGWVLFSLPGFFNRFCPSATTMNSWIDRESRMKVIEA